uniref:Insulin-like domain-containing protein n=1 Tax=Salarias fasciatus TaxID=181472 RepID=A0A672JB27_SALFA
MLWRLTLTVAAVCVGGVCGRVEADLMSRLIMPRDYGVKLCGREFIRAVIFTCGGSRWRRSTEDLDLLRWSFLSQITEGSDQHIWRRGVQMTDPYSPLHAASPRSLTDLLSLYGDSQPPADLTEQQEEEEPGVFDWSAASKKKRNFSLGVAGMCCTQGCTKNDIGRLC